MCTVITFSRLTRLILKLSLLSMLTVSPRAAAQDTLNSLTLEQKAAQLFMVSLYGQQLTDTGREFLQKWQPGGVALFEYNAGPPEAVARLTNSLQQTIIDAGGVPLFVAVDQEMGIITTFEDEGFTQWPVPMLLTATGDTELAYQVGQALANELRAVGVNMDFAPVADLQTNPDNPIIGRRSFGSDPQRTGQIVAAVIRGMQSASVIATAKHFPGHGDTSADSHVILPVITHDLDRLNNMELVPFRMAIDAGVESVMVAHIWFSALEPDENLPASLSYNVITGLLRRELGHDGLIISDALEMDAIDTVYGYEDAALRAIKAGVDLVAFGSHTGLETQASAIQAVINAVRRGDISESRLDESVRRVLDAKKRYGILNWQPIAPGAVTARIDLAAHQRLIVDMFAKGTTVAYNTVSAIPIKPDQQAALIYPATRTHIKRECGGNNPMVHAQGVSGSPTEQDIAWAVEAARRADIAVVFTQNAYYDQAQQSLVRALPAEKTIVVALWSPYDALKFPPVAAYMVTYSPLDSAISTACAILFGESPALGQLAIVLNPD